MGSRVRRVPHGGGVPAVLPGGRGRETLRFAGAGNADYKLNGESGYQNAMELLAAVVALMALAKLGVWRETVRLRGIAS